jgi:hypothetical protein
LRSRHNIPPNFLREKIHEYKVPSICTTNFLGVVMEGKSIGLEAKIRPQRRAHDLENQDAS